MIKPWMKDGDGFAGLLATSNIAACQELICSVQV
jgi:hypothetical protein